MINMLWEEEASETVGQRRARKERERAASVKSPPASIRGGYPGSAGTSRRSSSPVNTRSIARVTSESQLRRVQSPTSERPGSRNGTLWPFEYSRNTSQRPQSPSAASSIADGTKTLSRGNLFRRFGSLSPVASRHGRNSKDDPAFQEPIQEEHAGEGPTPQKPQEVPPASNEQKVLCHSRKPSFTLKNSSRRNGNGNFENSYRFNSTLPSGASLDPDPDAIEVAPPAPRYFAARVTPPLQKDEEVASLSHIARQDSRLPMTPGTLGSLSSRKRSDSRRRSPSHRRSVSKDEAMDEITQVQHLRGGSTVTKSTTRSTEVSISNKYLSKFKDADLFRLVFQSVVMTVSRTRKCVTSTLSA